MWKCEETDEKKNHIFIASMNQKKIHLKICSLRFVRVIISTLFINFSFLSRGYVFVLFFSRFLLPIDGRIIKFRLVWIIKLAMVRDSVCRHNNIVRRWLCRRRSHICLGANVPASSITYYVFYILTNSSLIRNARSTRSSMVYENTKRQRKCKRQHKLPTARKNDCLIRCIATNKIASCF